MDTDETRFLKCILVVVKDFPKMLQKTLQKSIPNSKDFYTRMLKDEIFKEKLSRTDHHTLQSMENGYDYLDITLMLKIISHYGASVIDLPTRKWGASPLAHEVTVGDDALRLREERNKFVHKVSAEVSELEFLQFFKKIIDIAVRFDKHLDLNGDNNFQNCIEKRQKEPINRAEADMAKTELQEVEGYKVWFAFEVEDKTFRICRGKSMENLISEIAKASPTDSTPFRLIIPSMEQDSEETVQLLKSLQELINNGSVVIQFLNATVGSIIMFLRMQNGSMVSDEDFEKELKRFLIRIFQMTGMQNKIKKQEFALTSVSFEDRAILNSEEKDINKEQSQSIVLSLKAPNSVLISDESFKSNLQDFFAHIVSLSNGEKVFQQTGITTMLEPSVSEPVSTPRKPFNNTDEEKLESQTHEYDYIPDYRFGAERPEPNVERQTIIPKSEVGNERPALPKRPPPPTRPPQPRADKIKSNESKQDDIQMAKFYGRREENEIRIVMVGRTGSGKSATGNTIMSKPDHFESKLTGTSVTRECKRGESSYHGRKLIVIDTPGLYDTKVSYEKISKEIIRCVNLSTPGPHVFLLVIQIARFTDEEIETFNKLFDLFGEGMGNFAIITFTKLDDLEGEGSTVEAYIKTAPAKLQFFLNRCNGNYIAINNKAPEKTKSLKVKELIQLIDKINNKNGGRHYSNEMYKEAEAALQRKIKEVEKQKALEKKKEIEKIQSTFVGQIDSMIQGKVANVLSSQESLQRQAKREKDKADIELRRMKEELKKIDKKRNEELYRIKQQEKQEKEKQAKLLEEKERQHMQLLQNIQTQHQETTKQFQETERRKDEQLAKVTETYNKRMAEETQRLINGNNEKYNEMMRALQVKDDANQRLQEQMAKQASDMQQLVRDRDRAILQQQEDHRKRMEEEKDKANLRLMQQMENQKKTLDETKGLFIEQQEQQNREYKEEMRRLKDQNERMQQEIKNKGCITS